MCGIAGYIGISPEQNLLYQLRLLEYRGYDSAGIAVSDGTKITVTKRAGELKNLETAIKNAGETPGARLGIGHTRWATHGKPNEVNAHPHVSQNGEWVIVHNGIIENHLELRDELKELGYTFYSATDTETAANLLEYYSSQDANPLRALAQTCARLKGSFALAILHSGERKIYFAKNKSPLYLACAEQTAQSGKTDGNLYLASDVICFQAHTRTYYALPDGVYGCADEEGAEFYDQNGVISLPKETISAAFESAPIGDYPHYMLKEIYDTLPALRAETAYFKQNLTRDNYPLLCGTKSERSEIPETPFLKAVLVGCGTAYHAALLGAKMIETVAKIDAAAYVGSEFRYFCPRIDEKTLAVFISQSGETADTLAALEEAKKRGAKTIAIVNAEHSTLAKAADMILPVKAGAEIAVASTKAYSCQTAALYALAEFLRAASVANEAVAPDFSALDALCGELSFGDEREEKEIARIFCGAEKLIMIGRGADYCTALEASLKIKETSYVNADVYFAGELKHGFLALVDENSYVAVFATDETTLQKTLSNAEEARARGAKIILFTTAAPEKLCGAEKKCFRILRIQKLRGVREGDANSAILPEDDNPLQCIQNVLPWQLIAYYMSVGKGLNPDKPRNLAKSVTVE